MHKNRTNRLTDGVPSNHLSPLSAEKAWLEREEAAEPAARQGRTQGRELDHDDDLYSATKKMSRVMRERDDIKAEMHRVQACAANFALAHLSERKRERLGGWSGG